MSDRTLRTVRLALIGCGAIGQEVLKYLDEHPEEATVVAVLDRDLEKVRKIVEKLRNQRPTIVRNLNELLAEKPSIVLEAASPEAVRVYVPTILARGIDVVILSVSALVDFELITRLRKICERSGARLLVPSGAIGGIDIVRAHAKAGLQEIVLETRKKPEALGLSVSLVQVVYEGNILDAIKRYPRNLNVYMTVLLATGLQYEKIRCRVIADPSAEGNIHRIYVRSRIGEAIVEVKNVTSEINPRTSLMAAYSAIDTILQQRDLLKIL